MNELAIFIIIVVGMYDLFLAGTDKRTLSEHFQELFPPWVDSCLMGVFIGVIYALPLATLLKIVLGVVTGHLCWVQRERHV